MTINHPTGAQLLVLRTAAQRSDAAVLPLPADLKVRGAALNRLLAGLITAGLVREIKVIANRPCWRTADGGQRYGLRSTVVGKTAAKAASEAVQAPSDDDLTPTIGSDASAPGVSGSLTAVKHPKGKLGSVAAAVGSEPGATLDELVALTGWQAHTARAALTGLRQRGFPISLVERDGRKAYRITAAG